MTPYKYVVAGLVLCGVGIVVVSWCLIRWYLILFNKNKELLDYIDQLDQEARELQDRLEELQEYLDQRNREGWFTSYHGTAGESFGDPSETAILSDVQEVDAGWGRHSREKMSRRARGDTGQSAW